MGSGLMCETMHRKIQRRIQAGHWPKRQVSSIQRIAVRHKRQVRHQPGCRETVNLPLQVTAELGNPMFLFHGSEASPFHESGRHSHRLSFMNFVGNSSGHKSIFGSYQSLNKSSGFSGWLWLNRRDRVRSCNEARLLRLKLVGFVLRFFSRIDRDSLHAASSGAAAASANLAAGRETQAAPRVHNSRIVLAKPTIKQAQRGE